jgi:GNAT superfamily N-acetyltransferase
LPISAPEIIGPHHDLSAFDCGKAALDDWLRTRAQSNQDKGFTAVLVVHDALRVVGFYGLAPTAVEAAIVPRRVRTGQPPNPIPCLLLGQLATDRAYAGQGIGTGLVKHALQRAVHAAQLTGGRALLVDAIDEEAAAFWRRRGFLPAPSNPNLLFRTMADVATAIRKAAEG